MTVKYDSDGNQFWTAPYAGSALATDTNGNLGVTGFGTSINTVKLSPAGSNLWVQSYGTSCGPALTVGQAIATDTSGNFYVTGNYPAFCYGPVTPYELLLIKCDASGNLVWTADYYGNGVTPTRVRGETLDGANNVFLIANVEYALYEVLEFSNNGELIWSATPNNNVYSEPTGLVLDAATNLLFSGTAGNNNPNFIYGTYKINTSGIPLWTNYYPEPPRGVSVATSIAIDSANNSYVTGYSPGPNGTNNIVTIKYDPNGNQLWLQRYTSSGNDNAAGNAIAVDNSGNVYVAGYETLPGGGTGIVTIKYIPVSLQRRADGTVLLETQGSPGESFDIEASIDLLNWLDLGTFFADTNGLLQFDDTNAPNFPSRFYYTNPQ